MIDGINRKKEQMKEGEKLVQEEKTTQKRKVESSKVSSKKAKLTSKNSLENVDLQEGSNSSGVPLKSTSASEKLQTAESAQSVSGDSLNDVSSRSKESSNSNKTKVNSSTGQSVYYLRKNLDHRSVLTFYQQKAIPDVERIEEPVIPDPNQSLDIILNEEKSPCGLSSEGYSLSPSPKSIEKANLFLKEIDKALDNQVQKINSPIEERDLIQEDTSATPKVPIQPDLDDLLQVISETKAGSEQGILNSDNKSVQQEKEDTPIQKARSESLKKVILKSAAEKMIRLINQPLDMLQKDPYWNNELVKVTSYIVEQQFPEKYRVQVSYFGKIFENLFQTREKLSDVRLKIAMIQENSNGIIIAEKALKEKHALYEKHLANANDTLEELLREKDALVKKLTEIQAQIQEIDEKITKLKKPFEKIQDKKTELKNQLSEIEKSKMENEKDLKRLQGEEIQEIDLFKGFEENKLQLKDTLEEFLKDL
ncbi:hypothetical protein PIB30_031982 [Stylosanthes scabra]|uniref:Uncharacterized protein n=1 Tax=Stylosanthes scabra TaxID=79078 RepID=A0ABU6UC81_9FABA|nr:hypothetical protein [Stylosanthes scabra]